MPAPAGCVRRCAGINISPVVVDPSCPVAPGHAARNGPKARERTVAPAVYVQPDSQTDHSGGRAWERGQTVIATDQGVVEKSGIDISAAHLPGVSRYPRLKKPENWFTESRPGSHRTTS